MSVQKNSVTSFVSNCFGETSPATTLLKFINQAAIGPAIFFLRMDINKKIQFRDSRILLSFLLFFLSFRNTSLGSCY